MNDIEVFRPGTFTDMHGRTESFSEATINEIASRYDPAVFQAPIVVGHPKDNHPAYGWIGGLSVNGGVLTATPVQVERNFSEMVSAGRFKKVSVSLFQPDHPSNPKPGRPYLRHVGFLGAAAPAVTGLKPVSFGADSAGVIEFTESDAFDLREWNLAERERALQSREAAFADQLRVSRENADTAAIEELITGGKVLPGEWAKVLAFMTSLGEEPISFTAFGSDAEVLAPRRQVFVDLMASMPSRLPPAGPIAGPEVGGGPVEFAAFSIPPGYSVDQRGLEIHRNAHAWMKSHPGASYRDAVVAVIGR
ncbi:Mu-like prophage I protein [uncultured Gammaproteobacteria bacterium]